MSALDSFDPETSVNFEEIEMQFAVKTVEHLEVSLRPANTELFAVCNDSTLTSLFLITGLPEVDPVGSSVEDQADRVSHVESSGSVLQRHKAYRSPFLAHVP